MAYIISLFWRSAKTGDRQRGKRLHLVKIVKATQIKCNDAKHKLTDFSKEKKNETKYSIFEEGKGRGVWDTRATQIVSLMIFKTM